MKADLDVFITPDCRHANPYQRLLADALARHGVTARFPAGYRRGLPITRAIAALPSRPDVLHLHWTHPYLKGASPVARSGYSAKLLLDLGLVKRAGTRIIWTVHNLLSHDTRNPHLEMWTYRRLARLVHRMVVHSPEAKTSVAAAYSVHPDKLAVIPHGVFSEAYGPAIERSDACSRLGLPQDRPILLFFGLVRPYKGVVELLEAWANSPSLHSRALLVIAGEAPDASYAAAVRARASAAPNVNLAMHFIPDEDVPAYFSAASAVVLPFKGSLTSGSIALAATYGVPVVSPRLDGTSATNAAGSCLYDPVQPNALVEALERIITEQPGKQQSLYTLPESHPLHWDSIALRHRELYMAAT